MKLNDLQSSSALPTGSDFVPLVKQAGAEVRLVCFHFAGGSAQSFLSWRQPCEELCELLAAELPGRSRRYNEPFHASIHAAAQHFADAYARQAPRTCVFYGHSLGALLAYETARILAERGEPGPERLVISSRSGPVSFPVSIGLPELSDASLMKYLRDLQGTKQSVLENKMLMDMMLPIIRADLEIIYGYVHRNEPVLEIPVDAIGAIDDKHCPFESLLDWRNVTRGEFRLRMIPGGHFAPIAEPGLVLETMRELASRRMNDHAAFV